MNRRRGRLPLAFESLEARQLMHGLAAVSDAYERDDTAAQAKTIATDGTAQTHSIHTGADVDWVKFTLKQKSNVVIATDGSSGDTEMRLYGPNSSSKLVEYDDDDGNGFFSRIDRSGAAALGPGTYYVRINEYGSNGTIGQYTISVLAQAQTASSRFLVFQQFGGSWCDAEKSPTNNDDDLMCWAAAASNVLQWTGWAQGTGNASADQVFQYFCARWSDAGGLPDYGFQWWFNGTNTARGWSGWSQVEYAGGRFFPSRSVSQYVHVAWGESGAMANINQFLRAGYGTTLGIFRPGGGHAITCWGFDFDPQNPQSYRGIWVTDSDDAKGGTNPPDQLQYYNVAQSGGKWYLQNYYGSNAWYIDEVVGLARRPAGMPLGGVALASANPMDGGLSAIDTMTFGSQATASAVLSLPPTRGDAAILQGVANASLLPNLERAAKAAAGMVLQTEALKSLFPREARSSQPAASLPAAADRALASFHRNLPMASQDDEGPFRGLALNLDWAARPRFSRVP